MPSFPDLIEPLRDGDVALRFGTERDIPEVLIAYQDDPELHVRMGEERPPSGAELGRYAEEAPGLRAAGTGLTFTILTDGSDACRGQVYVHHVNWDHARAELGIWVAPQARNGGVARRALALAGGWLLGPCRLERLAIVTEPNNEAMLGASKAAGFTYEGLLHSYLRERGRRIDAAVLSLLPRDLS